jgi:hypothetical protein
LAPALKELHAKTHETIKKVTEDAVEERISSTPPSRR